jgi:hypothetical protein
MLVSARVCNVISQNMVILIFTVARIVDFTNCGLCFPSIDLFEVKFRQIACMVKINKKLLLQNIGKAICKWMDVGGISCEVVVGNRQTS